MKPVLRAMALVLLAKASIACSIFRAPLTCPEKGGPAWTEVTSANFVLRTDVEPAQARTMAMQFEEMHAALAFVMQRPRPRIAAARVEVVLFERRADLFEVAGKDSGVGAYFTPWPPGDIEPQPVMVMYDEALQEDLRTTFLHELAHRFLHERFAQTPPWLDEGFAQYYSTLRIENGRAVLGTPGDLDFSEQPFFWMSWNGNAYQTQIPTYKAPTIRQLVEKDRSAFYNDAEDENISNEDRERQTTHYGAAWKLVHFFLNGPDDEHRQRFLALLNAMLSGAPARDAFMKTFEKHLPQLEQDFRRYLREARLSRLNVDLPAPPTAAPLEERAMVDPEVHVLWARLGRAQTKETAERAQRDLDEALARDPKSSEVRYRRAIFFLRRKRLHEATRELDRALATHPNDPRYLYTRLVVTEAQAEMDAGKGNIEGVSKELVHHLARVAKSPAQLSAAAWYIGKQGRPEDGVPLVERAIAADPLCWSCQKAYGALLFEAGRHPEALAAVDRAIAISPEAVPVKDLIRLRARIIQKQTSASQGAATPR